MVFVALAPEAPEEQHQCLILRRLRAILATSAEAAEDDAEEEVFAEDGASSTEPSRAVASTVSDDGNQRPPPNKPRDFSHPFFFLDPPSYTSKARGATTMRSRATGPSA